MVQNETGEFTKYIIDNHADDITGPTTIAEGVENKEQLDLLHQFNCNFVQGFLRGKPMPYHLCDAYLAGDVNALLKN